jgi:hypothetical protein
MRSVVTDIWWSPGALMMLEPPRPEPRAFRPAGWYVLGETNQNLSMPITNNKLLIEEGETQRSLCIR